MDQSSPNFKPCSQIITDDRSDVKITRSPAKQGLADRTAKTAVWVAVAAKPEVEIWRRPKK